MGFLGKLLLTAAVVFAVLLYLRHRHQQSAVTVIPAPRVVNPDPKPRRKIIGMIAAGVVVFLILGSGLWMYSYWQEQQAVLYLRVVDAGSGHHTDYRAHRRDIRDREFVTIEGVRVRLADTERLETTSIPPARN